MLWTLLAWIAFFAMLWFAWSAAALLRAASRTQLSMLWLVGLWQAAAAVGAFLLWRSASADTLSVGGIVGLVLAGSSVALWLLGSVAGRLRSHGVRLGTVLFFR